MGGRAAWNIGSRGQIDAEADNHSVAVAFEQDSGEFRAVDDQVVRPLEDRRQARRSGIDRFDQSEAGRKR
jgi:hypothetical protein